jgi:hypothetical protein
MSPTLPSAARERDQRSRLIGGRRNVLATNRPDLATFGVLLARRTDPLATSATEPLETSFDLLLNELVQKGQVVVQSIDVALQLVDFVADYCAADDDRSRKHCNQSPHRTSRERSALSLHRIFLVLSLKADRE